MQQNKVNLAAFNGSDFDKGAGFIKTALWYMTNALLIRASWNPIMSVKLHLLRMFGAKLGKNIVLKNNVIIKSPWNLIVGDNCISIFKLFKFIFGLNLEKASFNF